MIAPALRPCPKCEHRRGILPPWEFSSADAPHCIECTMAAKDEHGVRMYVATGHGQLVVKASAVAMLEAATQTWGFPPDEYPLTAQACHAEA